VSARLDGHAHRLRARKAPLESLPVRGDSALFEHFAVLGVEQAQVAVAVTEVDAGD